MIQAERIEPGSKTLDNLYQMSRRDALSDSLASFGEAVTGAKGYLVCNGYVIHGQGAQFPIITGDGVDIGVSEVIDCPDLIVNYLGLSIGRISGPQPNQFATSLAMIAVRLGLLSRILDVSYEHLKDRVSFGQKTLKHQLVKATFAEVYGTVASLREQMHLRAEHVSGVGLEGDHVLITEFNCKAEKLMGGHGYLLTGTHSLSYLSMLLFSVYATIG
jgi:hypothetical protein